MYINCEQAHFENKTTSLFILQILGSVFARNELQSNGKLTQSDQLPVTDCNLYFCLTGSSPGVQALRETIALQVVVYPWSWKVACLLIMRLRRNLRNVLGPLLVWGVLASGYSVRFTSRSTSMINRAENRTVKAVNKTLKVKDFE